MKSKSPETYVASNDSDTLAAGIYGIGGTQAGAIDAGQLANKVELSHLKEIFDLKLVQLEQKIDDIKESLKGRETRFWMINGIIIASLVAIFLWALPNIYRHDYAEKYKETRNELNSLNDRVQSLEKINIVP